MASKTGESSSSAQASSDALYAKWGHISFNNLVQEYGIRAEWNPVLPSKTDTTFPLEKGKITLFSDFFKFCNFRLPIIKFCKSVLDHYPLHISQLHLFGLVKLRQFEFACTALGYIPELIVFRAFFVLVWKSPFFTFDRRGIDISCLRDIPASSRDKDWKKKFFYIDAGVNPGEMQWREMGPKDKRLYQCPSEYTVIPEGTLVMAGMSLLWRDIRLYPSFQRDDEVSNVLKVHLDQFLLPAIPGDPSAYIFQPPPSGGDNASVAETKKPIWVKVTVRKYMAAGAATSHVGGSVSMPSRGVDVSSTTAELVSPTRLQKKQRIVPPLTAFQAIQTAHALPTGSSAEVQVEGVSSAPLTYVDVMPSDTSKPSLSELISQASAATTVSSLILPPVFTATVAVTTGPVSTPLPSSVIPTSFFDYPLSVFSASEKEMPTVSAAHEATSTRDTAVSDAGGSSSGIVDDRTRLGDDLYLPTINWDPNVQDKRYQPKWKIAKPSRLIFPPVVHHWVERAYPPAELAYVEGLKIENLVNATMVDSVSQPRRLAEVRRRWMHDNNELHQARAAIQELKDEKYRLESQLQAAGLRESSV
ncbi:hypothetical protein Hanom_Chr12g01092781 [Helianthus anomalus]